MNAFELEMKNWDELSKLKTGDKVKLRDGRIAEFVKLKQKNFVGIMNGGTYNISVTSFASVEEIAQKNEGYKSLKAGEAFYINRGDGKPLLFFFKEMSKGKIIAINPISKGKTTIDVDLFGGKVSEFKL